VTKTMSNNPRAANGNPFLSFGRKGLEQWEVQDRRQVLAAPHDFAKHLAGWLVQGFHASTGRVEGHVIESAPLAGALCDWIYAGIVRSQAIASEELPAVHLPPLFVAHGKAIDALMTVEPKSPALLGVLAQTEKNAEPWNLHFKHDMPGLAEFIARERPAIGAGSSIEYLTHLRDGVFAQNLLRLGATERELGQLHHAMAQIGSAIPARSRRREETRPKSSGRPRNQQRRR